MKKMKKFLSLILAGVILATASVTANATVTEDYSSASPIISYSNDTKVSGLYEYEVEKNNKTVILTHYLGNEKNVTIPSKIDGKPVRVIGNSSFYNCKNIETIKLPNTVEVIDDYAFFGCKSLKSLDIPESVTRLFYDLFIACTSLKSINVNSGNPCYKSIDGVLYYYNNEGMQSLISYPAGKPNEYYTIPNGTTVIFEDAFTDCYNLKKVAVPDSVTSMPNRIAFTVDSEDVKSTHGRITYFGGSIHTNTVFYGHYNSPLAKRYIENSDFRIYSTYVPLELGDVNLDGKITASDSLLVQRASINLAKLDEYQERTAFVHHHSITTSNAMDILRYTVGLDSELEKDMYPEKIPY